MKFVQLLSLVVPYHSVVASPLSYTSTVTAAQTYIPLIVISTSLFFLVVVFFVIKLVYMKHRRIGTIHASPAVRSIPTTSRDKQGNQHRGLLVGCLGSPTWETNWTSKLDEASWRRQQRRRSSFAYQLHTRSTNSTSTRRSKSKNSSSGSRFTKSFTSYSGYADQIVPPSSPESLRIPPRHGGNCSVQRNTSRKCHPFYSDFGEFHGVSSSGGGLPKVARRASPSSIRLVDGPSHSNQVEYSFLSALPPNAIVVSPPKGTRDSFQLSRYSLKRDCKSVPPLPSLPLFLPFRLPNGSGPERLEPHPLQAREYLPPLRFSPLASVAKVFYSQQQVCEKKTSDRVPDPGGCSNVPCLESASWSKISDAGSLTTTCVTRKVPAPHLIRKTNTKSNHERTYSCRGLAIGGSLARAPLVADEVSALPLEDKRGSEAESIQLRTLSGSSRHGSVASKKPLKSCLRQHSVVPLASSPDTILTPSMSATSTPTYGTRGDQVSLRTPISDDDIGMLGLDRFRWNDEIKELQVQSSHMKKDSIALVPLWE